MLYNDKKGGFLTMKKIYNCPVFVKVCYDGCDIMIASKPIFDLGDGDWGVQDEL